MFLDWFIFAALSWRIILIFSGWKISSENKFLFIKWENTLRSFEISSNSFLRRRNLPNLAKILNLVLKMKNDFEDQKSYLMIYYLFKFSRSKIHLCWFCLEFKKPFFSSLPGFPIMELLSMLFNFTFNQTNPDAINACLEIWDEYLDQMAVLEESSLSKVKPSVAYESLLVSLFTASLKKLRQKFWHQIRKFF